MDEPKQIYELFPRVMADVGAIGKDFRNAQQGYAFRSIDQVLNRLNPALVRHGVSLSIAIRDRQTATEPGDKKPITRTTLLLDLTFHAPDGSTITTTAAGEGMDYGGDKAIAKALTSGFKCGILLGLCVPVDADAIDDSDRDYSPEADPAAPRSTRSPAPRSTPPVYATPAENGRATRAQVVEIRELAKRLKLTRQQVDAALTARHVSRVEDLAEVEADEIIGHLKGRLPA